MPRQKSITDEEIVNAAKTVFMKNGFQATTAEIAEEAGISEGTIYQRFNTKVDLLKAVLDIPRNPEWVETINNIDREGNLRNDLTQLSNEIIDFFVDILPQINMAMCSHLDQGPLFEAESEALPAEEIKQLILFFHREQKLGRISITDPEIVARMYLGAMFHFAFAEVSGLNDILPMPKQTYIRGVVENLMNGIVPDPEHIEDE